MSRLPLTKAQEELMGYVWRLGECTVGQLRDAIAADNDGQKPAHSTVSTLMKQLLEKGYLNHKIYGRTFNYTPRVPHDEYRRKRLSSIVNRFFGGSAQSMVSFLVAENDLSLSELAALTDQLNTEDQQEE
ncbi:MAG: BlaI/MecI/CopY family transcriptional regulator [Bacteroidota bacterium]